MNSQKNTEQQNQITEVENQITEEEKRKNAIKWLESGFVNKKDEKLMDAFDNQNKFPWTSD